MKRTTLTALSCLLLWSPSIALAATATATAPAPQASATAVAPAFHLDVNEAISQIGSGMDQALTKLGALAVEYGTKAIELAAAVVQAQSIANLVVGAVWLGLAVVLINWGRKKPPADMNWCVDSFESLGVIGRILIGWGAGIWALFNAEPLLNVWNWVGAFAPKLALARMIFDKVAG